MATVYTQWLRLTIPDSLDAVSRSNLYKIDQLGASGLFDASADLTLRSDHDIVLRPGSGVGGTIRFNHKIDSLTVNAVQLQLNDDIVFSGNFSLPWARVSKSGASVQEFADFDTQVQNNAEVAAAYSHTLDTANPHATTAAQVGAYTTAQADTLLAGKAALVHTHTASQVTDFDVAVGNSPTASTLTSHVTNATIHFTEASIDHTHIQNIGANTHAQIDAHLANTNNPHGVTALQLGVYTTAQSDAILAAHNVPAGQHGVAGNIVGTSDTQALTNKQIDASLNTLTNISDAAVATNAGIDGSKISPDFGNQVINTDDGITLSEGGYAVKLVAAQSGMNADFQIELPPADGTSGQVLSTNGSGVLSWSSILGSTLANHNVYVGDPSDQISAVDTSAVGQVFADSTAGLTVKAGSLTPAAFTAFTANRAVVTDGSGVLAAASTTATEIGYVGGVTSAIQSQLNGKEPDLGDPAADGYALVSTAAGMRSWADPATFGFQDPLTTRGDLMYRGAVATTRLPLGSANKLLQSDGTDATYALLVDANVGAAAAIARTKLASGTADHVVINSPAGVLSSEAQLATTRGGTGISSTATFPASGTVATDTNTLTLSNKTIAAASNTITGLTDTNIAAGAAIAYSKLNLAGSIVNADVAAGAAIALSKLAALTINRALVSDGSGVVSVSAVTATELGYVSGVTSSIQTQLNAITSFVSFKDTWTSGTSKTVTHGLGTLDVVVQLYDITTGATIYVNSIIRTSTTQIDLTATQAPTGSGWKIIVIKA